MTAPRRVAILQSNYIPWKGYFDLIRAVDLFIVLDEVQFTKNDWRNRNRIKTPAGPRWLSIPVATAANRSRRHASPGNPATSPGPRRIGRGSRNAMQPPPASPSSRTRCGHC